MQQLYLIKPRISHHVAVVWGLLDPSIILLDRGRTRALRRKQCLLSEFRSTRESESTPEAQLVDVRFMQRMQQLRSIRLF